MKPAPFNLHYGVNTAPTRCQPKYATKLWLAICFKAKYWYRKLPIHPGYSQLLDQMTHIMPPRQKPRKDQFNINLTRCHDIFICVATGAHYGMTVSLLINSVKEQQVELFLRKPASEGVSPPLKIKLKSVTANPNHAWGRRTDMKV